MQPCMRLPFSRPAKRHTDQDMRSNQNENTDWSHYRSILPGLRERYLGERNRELVAMLARDSHSPTENFWAAFERMQEVGNILRDCLDDHRRSRMMNNLLLMYHHRMIADDDLNGFREEVREKIRSLSDILG